LELYSDKVNCTNREGEKTLDQMWHGVSESLLVKRLKIPPAKDRE
jgi:hypothetical protein